MSHHCMKVVVGGLWGVTVLVLASAAILPRYIFWQMHELAKHERIL